MTAPDETTQIQPSKVKSVSAFNRMVARHDHEHEKDRPAEQPHTPAPLTARTGQERLRATKGI